MLDSAPLPERPDPGSQTPAPDSGPIETIKKLAAVSAVIVSAVYAVGFVAVSVHCQRLGVPCALLSPRIAQAGVVPSLVMGFVWWFVRFPLLDRMRERGSRRFDHAVFLPAFLVTGGVGILVSYARYIDTRTLPNYSLIARRAGLLIGEWALGGLMIFLILAFIRDFFRDTSKTESDGRALVTTGSALYDRGLRVPNLREYAKVLHAPRLVAAFPWALQFVWSRSAFLFYFLLLACYIVFATVYGLSPLLCWCLATAVCFAILGIGNRILSPYRAGPLRLIAFDRWAAPGALVVAALVSAACYGLSAYKEVPPVLGGEGVALVDVVFSEEPELPGHDVYWGRDSTGTCWGRFKLLEHTNGFLYLMPDSQEHVIAVSQSLIRTVSFWRPEELQRMPPPDSGGASSPNDSVPCADSASVESRQTTGANH
jgi:hypothetical protein